MLDSQFIRDNPQIVREATKNKQLDPSVVDEVLNLDILYRKLLVEVENLRAIKNQTQKNVKGIKPTKDQIIKGKEIRTKLNELEAQLETTKDSFFKKLQSIPNIPSADTPIGKDESENVVIREHGQITKFNFEPKEHWEIGEALDLIDMKRAAKVSGARFAYLKGDLSLMQFALMQFVAQSLSDENILKQIIKKNNLKVTSKPFVVVIPPVMIRPEPFQQMDRLEPKDERYYIPSDDVYLIGSAEHTLGTMHMDETFSEEELPIRYLGYSTSFRREAGSYGKDMKGILRVHQFDKLEMESFSTPETGGEEQNLFVAIQEFVLQSLELPYQVMAICTGDMGRPDAKQIDMNTWLPGQNKYRETHTSDYMTDYQSRRLNIRVRRNNGNSEYVHMNDATASAIGRTLIAIIENYQQSDGSIKIPAVLQPYMAGRTIIKSKTK